MLMKQTPMISSKFRETKASNHYGARPCAAGQLTTAIVARA